MASCKNYFFCTLFWVIISVILITWISELNIDIVKPLQTDAPLLDVTYFSLLHTLLRDCCRVLLGFATQSMKPSHFWVNNSQHFFCSVIVEASRNNVGSICTALPTLLGSHRRITHGLQRLMSCILPTMHCRSQHCRVLLYPFSHHCQHRRGNS